VLIYGMKAALGPTRGQKDSTIINVVSILAMRGAPLHAAHIVAKHGIPGFTETLQLELMHERTPIKATQVMPVNAEQAGAGGSDDRTDQGSGLSTDTLVVWSTKTVETAAGSNVRGAGMASTSR
jgi:short-subunit dehydrogenase